MPTVEIEIPSRSAYVGVVRLALASLARAAGLDEERVDDLKIAVGEACANAVLANVEAGGGAPVRVSWGDERDRVVIEVDDRGTTPPQPVSPHGGPGETGDPGDLGSRQAMSMALLDQLVDECELVARPEGGTRARLILRTGR